MIRGSKVCGILQESIIHNNDRYFIVGIGINLVKSPKIKNKQVSFLQKYNNNKINKNDICKKIKLILKIYLNYNMFIIGDIGNTETKNLLI